MRILDRIRGWLEPAGPIVPLPPIDLGRLQQERPEPVQISYPPFSERPIYCAKCGDGLYTPKFYPAWDQMFLWSRTAPDWHHPDRIVWTCAQCGYETITLTQDGAA